jgi:hypothetical protein
MTDSVTNKLLELFFRQLCTIVLSVQANVLEIGILRTILTW